MKQAVITPSHVYYSIDEGKRQRMIKQEIACPASIADMISLAQEIEIQNFWICPGSELSNITPQWCELAPASGYKASVKTRPHDERGKPDHVMHVNTWQEGRRGNVRVTLPEWDYWEWKESNPVSLLAGVYYLGSQVPHIERGAPLAGRALMESTVNPEWVATPEIDFTEINKDAGRDMAFHRAITAQELADGLVLIALDKNSEYLGASTGAKLGAGTPQEIKGGQAISPDKNLPGLWYCTVDLNGSPYNGLDMPCPLYDRIVKKGQGWISTQLLLECIEVGYKVEVQHGYQWDKEHSHRILEQWAGDLWKYREAFKNIEEYFHPQGRALAYSGVKTVATKGLGLVRSEDSLKYAPAWYHPDWWHIIVELGKVRMLAQVRRIFEKTGLVPLAIATDCLYYAAPRGFIFPGLTIDDHKLGGYKVACTLPLNQELAQELDACKSGGSFARVVRTYAKGNN